MGTTSQLAYETATDAFNARDLDRFADAVADDVAFQRPCGIGGEGKTESVAFYPFSPFPPPHSPALPYYRRGGHFRTHTGIARTGRAVALDYVLVLRSKDGKQVSMSLMLERLLMLEQLGLTGDGGELL